MTPADVVQRAESEGIRLIWRMVDGVARILAELPEDLDAAPAWMAEEKAIWDAEAVRLAIMAEAGQRSEVLDAAAVVRRCRREGIRLTVEENQHGPTVGYSTADGRELPGWLRDWALFNPAASLLALGEEDVADDFEINDVKESE